MSVVQRDNKMRVQSTKSLGGLGGTAIYSLGFPARPPHPQSMRVGMHEAIFRGRQVVG